MERGMASISVDDGAAWKRITFVVNGTSLTSNDENC